VRVLAARAGDMNSPVNAAGAGLLAAAAAASLLSLSADKFVGDLCAMLITATQITTILVYYSTQHPLCSYIPLDFQTSG